MCMGFLLTIYCVKFALFVCAVSMYSMCNEVEPVYIVHCA